MFVFGGAVFHRFVECSCATIANGICSACRGITRRVESGSIHPGALRRRPPCPPTLQTARHGRARAPTLLLQTSVSYLHRRGAHPAPRLRRHWSLSAPSLGRSYKLLIAPTRPLPPSPPPGSRWTLAALLREARARPLTELGSDASGDETDETRYGRGDETDETRYGRGDETDETRYGRGDETDETRTRPGSRAEDARRLVSRARQSVEHDASALASWSSSYDELQDLRLVGADSLAKRVLRDCELFQHASVVTASCAPKISQDLPRSP
jgi:hypothetical protein